MGSTTDTVRLPEENVYQFVYDAFIAADVDETVAELTARGLWNASIRGVDSHGIRLLPHYLDELEGGRINPEPNLEFELNAPSIGRLDADHTYGLAAGMCAMRKAIELASETGAAHISVRNSSHCGSMAYFGLEAARNGMIGFATTHGTANTQTPGSTRPFFGNNPICVTAPMRDESPFCFDSAMTPITFNKVKQHRDSGEPLPPGVAADENGEATCDPYEADQLRYIGDYKGFGLAMVGDVLNGLLSGMPVGRDISSMFDDPLSEHRRLGHYFAAVRIDPFQNLDEFKSRLQELADEVRNEPQVNGGTPIMVPGDPEKQARTERKADGIPIPDHDLERFNKISDRLGIQGIRS